MATDDEILDGLEEYGLLRKFASTLDGQFTARELRAVANAMDARRFDEMIQEWEPGTFIVRGRREALLLASGAWDDNSHDPLDSDVAHFKTHAEAEVAAAAALARQ